jgi:hypothetical protein
MTPCKKFADCAVTDPWAAVPGSTEVSMGRHRELLVEPPQPRTRSANPIHGHAIMRF